MTLKGKKFAIMFLSSITLVLFITMFLAENIDKFFNFNVVHSVLFTCFFALLEKFELLIVFKKVISLLFDLTGIGTILLAYIAYRALGTWKDQIRTEKHLEFMDELTDVVHEYIELMNAPMQKLKYINMRMKCYSETNAFSQEQSGYGGEIAYIKKNGIEDGKQLFQYLDKIYPITSKMLSLATKGQVLGLINYDHCYNACQMLSWSYRQIESVAAFISSNDYNWDNTLVQTALERIMTIDEKDIRKSLEEQNKVFLEFVAEQYHFLFKK